MKVLIIDDDIYIRELVKGLLKNESYELYTANTGFIGLEEVKRKNPDLIILDVVLNDMTGFEVCEKIRKRPDMYGNPYILMLTSKTDDKDVIKGFEKGVDDYLKKPFNEEELVFRVRSILRKRENKVYKVYKYGDIVIDLEKNIVLEEKEEIKLAKLEYDFLLYLIINMDIVLSREKIYENVWNDIFYPNNRTVDVYINKLKNKLKAVSKNLESVRGFGYRLKKIKF